MIYFYSGTPGSGKSLHMAKDIMFKLRRGKNVLCNVPINMDVVKHGILGSTYKKIGNFSYISDIDLRSKKYPQKLIDYALKNRIEKGGEGQFLLVIDECQRIWASRGDRLPIEQIKQWEDFFSLHRHLGYNIILVSQNDRMVARYLRGLFEYEIRHRNANKRGLIGMLLPFKMFSVVTYWYGVRERLGVEFFFYRKIYSKLYDSYATFINSESKGKGPDLSGRVTIDSE